MAGYSGTPLPQKLGIKPGERIVTIGAPANYRELLSDIPPDAVVTSRISRPARFVHLFVRSRCELARQLAALRGKIDDSGILWVSWPKKSSRVTTDVTEDVIRNEALPLGFVDVKVCAVDETWSGLKLMIRRTERKASARR
jgi:hypothetical protein